MSVALVIRNGTVIDGTCAPPVRADVAIENGRIAAIGHLPAREDCPSLDATGCTVAPGFIDIHSHSDLTLLLDPRAVSAIAQGVTTEVIGNCGHGCAPILDPGLAKTAIYGPVSELSFGWHSVAGYLERLEQARPAVNVAALVPNGQLRLGTLGTAQRPANPDELERMKRALVDGLDEGAFGFSTGLEYALAAEAVAEALRTARAAGVRLQVSHITPRAGHDVTARCLELVADARAGGQDVAFDMHTRLFGFTHLKNLLPSWALAGAPDAIATRLRDPSVRDQVRGHSNLITRLGDWERVALVNSPRFPELAGVSLAEIGRRWGKSPLDAAYDILAAEAADLLLPMVILQSYSEPLLRLTYREASCMIGSDATTLAPDGALAKEIFYGAYTWAAWFYRRIVRELGDLSPAQAVARLAALPARVMGLDDRGVLAAGKRADIVVFDPDRFGERGTVEQPNRLAEGMVHVVVNGVPALRDGAPTGQRNGHVLRARR